MICWGWGWCLVVAGADRNFSSLSWLFWVKMMFCGGGGGLNHIMGATRARAPCHKLWRAFAPCGEMLELVQSACNDRTSFRPSPLRIRVRSRPGMNRKQCSWSTFIVHELHELLDPSLGGPAYDFFCWIAVMSLEGSLLLGRNVEIRALTIFICLKNSRRSWLHSKKVTCNSGPHKTGGANRTKSFLHKRTGRDLNLTNGTSLTIFSNDQISETVCNEESWQQDLGNDTASLNKILINKHNERKPLVWYHGSLGRMTVLPGNPSTKICIVFTRWLLWTCCLQFLLWFLFISLILP